MNVTHTDQWQGRYLDLVFYIRRRPNNLSGFKETWTFYIFIREDQTPKFKNYWLEDQVQTGYTKPYISHNYFSLPFDMPGGITYYEKHGHTEGYRAIEIGCDYMHSWNEGQEYSLEDILIDVKRAIEDTVAIIKPNDQPTS